MKKIKKYAYLLILSILLQSCKSCTCPSDVRVGGCFLTQNSLDFVPYEGGETLTFVNSTGDLKQFFISKRIEYDKRIIGIFCAHGAFDVAKDYVASTKYDYQLQELDSTLVEIHQAIYKEDIVNSGETDSTFVDEC